MYLEIVSPEATLYSGDVESLSVPGVDGQFQMLENHASIVSLLKDGELRIKGNLNIDEQYQSKFSTNQNGDYCLEVLSGTVEFKNNKLIVLID